MVSFLKENGKFDEYAKNIKDLYAQNGKKLNSEKLLNEVAANATEAFLSDPEGWQNTIAENKTFSQKLLDFIGNFIEYLKEQFGLMDPKDEAAKAFSENIEELQRIEKLWSNAFEVAKAVNISNDNESYSIKDSLSETKNRIVSYVSNVLNAKPTDYFNNLIIATSISERLANDINGLFGYSIKSNCDVKLAKDDVWHIKKRHGGGVGSSDNSMGNINNYGIIADVMNDYDHIEKTEKKKRSRFRNHDSSPAEKIVIKKTKDGVTTEIVEAIALSKNGENTLWIISCYSHGYGNTKKETSEQVPDAKPPGRTSETDAAKQDVSNSKIEHVNKNVNNTEFSLKKPVEQTKNLIAVHNLNSEKLLSTLDLGGFPMPSIAVTKAELGHTSFGDITVMFRGDTINPSVNKKNKVYAADAWTPTFPRVEYEANMKAVREARDIATKDISGNIPEMYENRVRSFLSGLEYNLDSYGGKAGLIDRAKTDYAMKAAYLASKGEKVDEIVSETRTEMDPVATKKAKMAIDKFGEEAIKATKTMTGQEIYDKYGYELKKMVKEQLIEAGIDAETAEQNLNGETKQVCIIYLEMWLLMQLLQEMLHFLFIWIGNFFVLKMS